MTSEREQSVFKAKVAEQAECFNEMVVAMKKVVQLNPTLSVEERNLLSIAYKNLISPNRTAWRIITQLHDKEKNKDPNSWKLAQMTELRGTVEKQLTTVCGEILDLIDQLLLPGANDAESKVFWNKMKGDYYRYIAEFEKDDKKTAAQKKLLILINWLLTKVLRFHLVVGKLILYF
jgi:14-3-3 protein epsilon